MQAQKSIKRKLNFIFLLKTEIKISRTPQALNLTLFEH